jgi:energy-coupling factor transport system ATP-binding protein
MARSPARGFWTVTTNEESAAHMATVRIQDLTFAYPGMAQPVLRDVNLTISAGEVVLLTGPSGCGKSTLALTLSGLIPSRITGRMRGSVSLDATSLSQLSIREIAQQIGIVFQNPDNQLIQLTVEEEVAFGPENLNLPPSEIERRVVDALAATGMLALRHDQIYALSGGQKQRVVIAAALAMTPKILVLDEPTSDLDPAGTQEVLKVLRELNTREGMAILLIEHKTDEVIAWVDRVLLMDRGSIVLDAHPSRAFADSQRWQALGVAVPQLIQVAQSLPDVFPDHPPLTMDAMVDALEDTAYARALEAHAVTISTQPAAMPPLMSWREVDLVYDRHQVLFGVSMELYQREWLALIGANGSGKTSLASLVMGFQDPTHGRIEVEGRLVRAGNISRQARSTAYLFQAADTMLFADTVENELQFGLRHTRSKQRDGEFSLEKVLAISDLIVYRRTNPFHLSHGQRKRLAIGALLTRQPTAVILDEPTTGQDEQHARTFLQFLEGLRESHHLTYLMITHDMRAVATYATRVVVLRDGRLVLNGHPAAVFARRAELAECGILPPPMAQLHARLCHDLAPAVALTVPEFLHLATTGMPTGGART